MTTRLLQHAGYQAVFRSYPGERLYNGLRDGSIQLWPGAPGKAGLAEHTLETRAQLGQSSSTCIFVATPCCREFPKTCKDAG
nr:hypothetical protein [Pseudomonas sp. CC6-YY-74]